MSVSTESIIGDPAFFSPGRGELNFSKMGLEVVDAEWGDSEHELFLIRQLRGEIPADRHPPNRTATIKLRVKQEEGFSIAEAAALLQQKVGIWQEEGGWVQRNMDLNGGFLSSVAVPVLTAQLGGLHGWLMAHRQTANEVTLVLTIGPTFYGVNERESAEVVEETNRELIWKIKKVAGSAPGLLRSRITNKNGTANLQSVIEAIESRDYPGEATENTTAALAYEAEKLTRLNNCEEVADGESSGGKALKMKVANSWRAMVGSEIAGVGHMTHVGPRRIKVRVFDGCLVENKEQTEYQLEYRALGSAVWSQCPAVTSVIANKYGIVDLGECRIDRAVLGNQRWEFRINIKTNSAAVGTFVWLDKIWVLPAEQLIQATVPITPNTPVVTKMLDGFNKEGAATGKEDEIGNVYVALEKSDTDDFTEAGGVLIRATISDTGTLL